MLKRITDAEWKAVRDEYINNPESTVRQLAKKYSISQTTIANRSKAEQWLIRRKELLSASYEEALHTANVQGSPSSADGTTVQDVAKTLLCKVRDYVILLQAGDCNPQAVRHITAALKDIQDIMKGDEQAVQRVEVFLQQAGAEEWNQ